jgi:uncharacterized protein involved in exopolysaccharide biosynthesis
MTTKLLREDSQPARVEISQMETADFADSRTKNATDLDRMLDIALVLARHKRLILFILLISLAVSTLIACLLPNHYISETRIMPPQQSQSASTALLGQLAPLAALAGKDIGVSSPSAIYVAILQGRTVQDAIIKQFDLTRVYGKRTVSETRLKLASRTEISAATKSGVITVTMEDLDAKRAADMANAYIQELHTLTRSLALTEASRRRVFFQQELEEEKGNLAEAEESLKNTQQKTGLIQLDSQARSIIQNAATLRSRIAGEEVKLRAMRSFATDQNPEYVLAQQELAGLREQLARAEHGGLASDGSTDVATSKVPQAGLEYMRRVRDVKYHEMVFELLAKEFEAAKIDEAKDAALIQVIDSAVPADKKSSPHRLLIVLSVTGGCMVIGLLGILGFELVKGSLDAPEQRMKLRSLKNEILS